MRTVIDSEKKRIEVMSERQEILIYYYDSCGDYHSIALTRQEATMIAALLVSAVAEGGDQ